MMKKLAFKFVLAITLVSIAFVGYTAFSIWSYSYRYEDIQTDAAIVLGAAVWNDEPSPVLQQRIKHAIKLYEEGYVDKLIFTGGQALGDSLAESEVAREYAIENNVPAEDILIETKSTITEENLQYAYDIASKENLKSFSIVSDPLHMKRAMVMAEDTGLDAYPSPTQTSAYKSLKSKLPFFFREVFYYCGYVLTKPFT